jgi:hypothetical protein
MTKKAWDDEVEKDKKVYDDLISEFSLSNNLAEDLVKELAAKIFDIGFSEGQRFVWFQRSGFGMSEEKDLGYTMTVSDGETKTYEVGPDGGLKEVEGCTS